MRLLKGRLEARDLILLCRGNFRDAREWVVCGRAGRRGACLDCIATAGGSSLLLSKFSFPLFLSFRVLLFIGRVFFKGKLDLAASLFSVCLDLLILCRIFFFPLNTFTVDVFVYSSPVAQFVCLPCHILCIRLSVFVLDSPSIWPKHRHKHVLKQRHGIDWQAASQKDLQPKTKCIKAANECSGAVYGAEDPSRRHLLPDLEIRKPRTL